MPVTYPVVELIAQELLSRLEAMINNNAYQTTVREVIRPTRNGNYTPKNNQIVLTMGDAEIVEELSHPGNPPAIATMQTFNIRCHVLTDENETDAIDTTVTMFVADVMQAVCIPQSTWHNFDSNAIDASFGPVEFIANDGGLDGANIPINVLYRVSENDPYEVRA